MIQQKEKTDGGQPDGFFFNNCGLFPEMHGVSQKQMNTTWHYRRFWSQQFHLQWDDWPEKQALLKDVSKRGTMYFAIPWLQNLLRFFWQSHGIRLFLAKWFRRKRRGLIFEKKLKNLQTAQEIPLEGILLIASYFNAVLQPILILKPKLPCIVLATF